jgi:hypothetical protein
MRAKMTENEIAQKLKELSLGVYYVYDRSDVPYSCSHVPVRNEHLDNPANITYRDIDYLLHIGWARESKYRNFTGIHLTYRGKFTLLRLNNFDFKGWQRRNTKYMCCYQAIPNNCVCIVSTLCPEHGLKHNGTHD